MAQRILIIAGEASGDAHGAGVVRALLRRQPTAEIFGIGGDLMQAAGMKLMYHIREMSFMGFAEVIRHLPLIRSVEKALTGMLTVRRPDVVVLIDYPGFNLRFARIAKRHGVKVVYYISPQVWAWKRGRVKTMKRIIDKMLVVFPFEVPIYRQHGIPVEFVGHPLMEEMKPPGDRSSFCRTHGLDGEKEFIAVIPGSRKQEIRKLLPVMVEAARKAAGENRHVVVAVAPNLSKEEYTGLVPAESNMTYIQHATHDVMHHAVFAFVTSGTATLETACSGTPMVVVYKTSPITYWIARLVVRIKNIALVNIVAGKTVVPELIQGQVTVDNLVREANAILTNPHRTAAMTDDLAFVRRQLGGPGASAKAAEAILSI